jgi:hypothetical protein
MFPKNAIIFSCYENALPVNLKFLWKQEGKCSWKELMQGAQVIKRDVIEIGANILNFPIYFQNNRGMELEEFFYERREIFSGHVLETEE